MKPIRLPDGILDVDVYPLHLESWYRESETECYITTMPFYENGGLRQCTPELIDLIEADRPKTPEPPTNEDLMKEYDFEIENAKEKIAEYKEIKELLYTLNSVSSKRLLTDIDSRISEWKSDLKNAKQHKKELIEWIEENDNKQFPIVVIPR